MDAFILQKSAILGLFFCNFHLASIGRILFKVWKNGTTWTHDLWFKTWLLFQ